MADNDIVDELTVEHGKRTVVGKAFERIRLLFHVLVNFSTPEESAVKSGIQWLALKGEKDSLNKAKEYIKSLCNPELVISVPFAEQFFSVLYNSWDDLERSTSAVVKFPSRKECSIQGSAEAVIMAQSAIEDKLKTPQPPAIEPQLREFAIKLGYSNQVIDQAVQKLGSNVTQNTLLNELLKQTASLPYQISATPSQPKPSSGPVAPHSRQREVVARGAPNASSIMRSGYENPPDHMVRAPIHPHWDREPSPGPSMPYNRRDVITKGMPDPVSRLGYEIPGDVMERCAPRGTKRGFENQRPDDIVARGCSSAQPLMNVLVGPYGNQVSPLYDSREIASSSGMTATEARLDEQEQLMYQQIVGAKKASVSASSNLRPIVIDGSNVAMSHGRQDIYSCRGIQLCVDWFRDRGHKEITVFVPSWRKEASRPDKPITDQEVLHNLERDGILVFTPSRKVNGRRIVCYDDRFIIKLAAETDGIVVSNDNFRDLTKENAKWRETIEQRLLMYSFVGDMFMVPDDPLGKHGPNLTDFLRKGSATHPKICPYLKKCTYGLKCRFYHPERDQEAINLKLEKLIDLFGESFPESAMRKVISDNPTATVTVLVNILCDSVGNGHGKH